MSNIVRQIHHFTLHPDVGEVSHEDIAAEALRLTRGGYIVSLALPGGEVTVNPDDAAEDVTALVRDAMPAREVEAGEAAKPRGRRGS